MKKTDGKKYPLYFYVITYSIPFLILLLIEISLRIGGYSPEIPQWINPSVENTGKLVLNPEITTRYFKNLQNYPHSIFDVFDKDKKPGTFRIFVLGESSAAGFPYSPTGSFSRFLNYRLQGAAYQQKIEVINLGIAAINSYTIIDLLPGVLEQKPDLILIYTGHNEFYGAMGAASNEKGNIATGLNRFFANFKIYKLLQNFVSMFYSPETPQSSQETGGLMERLSKGQLIPLDSEIYKSGVNQFEENLKYILSEITKQNIPVIISTLPANIRDLEPFVPGEKGLEVFNSAQDKLADGDSLAALKLFIEAKDRDELKFRAPSEFNEIIKRMGKSFNVSVIDIDSAFNSQSKYGITGDELMTDHLHPVLSGYQLISDLFFENILKSNLINGLVNKNINPFDFPFSTLDSVIADQRIGLIKSQWPFSKEQGTRFNPPLNNLVDSLAFQVVTGKINWDKAHAQLAARFFAENNYPAYTKQYSVLISQYPYIKGFTEISSYELMKVEEYDLAYSLLYQSMLFEPTAYNTKWLGIIDLSKSRITVAEKHLIQSVSLNSRDPQTLYNLSGVYITKGDFKSAEMYLSQCVSVDPQFPGAASLLTQVRAQLKK
ncbi:MAG: hypothetical protein IAE91_05090 [Ignavibacteriaceae bacterium]|nr:hypothetical protein [Ignavibacteriaceae bacterium]